MGNKGSTESDSNASYIWKIPSFRRDDIYLLVTGYIREYEINNNLINIIPIDIIRLFTIYFNDHYEIEKIKSAKPGDSFKSNVFGVDKFRFEIEICPNGEGINNNDHGQFTLFVNLLSIPPQISKLQLSYNTSFLELNIKNSDQLEFSRNITSYRWSERLNIEKIKDLNTFTFKIDIKGIKLFYKENDNDDDQKQQQQQQQQQDNDTMTKCVEIVDTKCINILNDLSLPQGYYLWKIHDIDKIKNIKNIKKDDYISSDLFEIASLKWIIKLYKCSDIDNDDDEYSFCVYIVSLSPNIMTLFVSYKIIFYERDITQGGCIEFKDNAITFWPTKLSNLKQITNLDTITLKLQVTVLDAFDKNNNQIKNIYTLHNPYSLLISNNNNNQCGKYIWKINDNDIMSKIKCSKVNHKFQSKCFELNECKYCLSLYPNGYNIDDDKNEENNVALMLNLLSPPPNIQHVTLCFKLILHETGNTATNYATFLAESFWGFQEQIDISNCNTLTMEVIITVIDVFNEDGISVNNNNKYEEKQDDKNRGLCQIKNGLIARHEWNITDKATINRIKCAKDGNVFISPIFELYNLHFVIEFYPEAIKTEKEKEKDDMSAIYISLLSIPEKVHSMLLGYTIKLKETNTEDSGFVQFHDQSTSIGWSRCMAPHSNTVKNLNQFSIQIELNLFHIYSKKSQIITSQFVNNNHHNNDIIEYGKKVDVELGTYQWIINDVNLIKQLKEAQHSEFFRSPLFSMHGFKFFMQITPNGANPSDEGNFGCFLYVASLPPNISKITLIYELLLLETDTLDCYATQATPNRTTCGWFRNLKFRDILNMNKFTFDLKLGIIDIYDENGNITTLNQEISKQLCSNLQLYGPQKCQWKIKNKQLIKRIKNATHKQYFDGPIFGDNNNCNNNLKWCIRFTPNGQNDKTRNESTLGIKLMFLPNHISGVSVYFKLFLKELNTNWTYCSHFRRYKDNDDYLTQSWQTCRIKFKQIQHCKSLTIIAEIYIIDIYDIHYKPLSIKL